MTMFRTVIGRGAVDTLVPVIASAEIGAGRPARARSTKSRAQITKQSSLDREVIIVKRGRPKADRTKPLYKKDPTRVGKGYRIACTSWVPSELAELDAAALAAGKSRSEFLALCFRYYRDSTR